MGKNILVVQYTPRGQRSKTKEILGHLLSLVPADAELTNIDLCQDVPHLLLPDNLAAYLNRDYAGQKLDPKSAELLAQNDRFIQQIRNCDIFVIAYPMYNFSQPATVKAYFDAILLKGHTWDMTQQGFIGLLEKNKKAIVITTSGGDYSSAPMLATNHSDTLTMQLLKFMGFNEVRCVNGFSMNMSPDPAQLVSKAEKELDTIATEWFY